MYVAEEELAYRKKIRTYLKRSVTALSIILGLAYLATLWFNNSGSSLYFAICGTILSFALLALNSWSLNDHLHKHNMNKKVGIENTYERKKLIRISLDMISSTSSSLGGITSLVGNIASLSLHDHSIIFAISILFFALGYTIMAVNIVWSCSSYLDTTPCEENFEPKSQQNHEIDNLSKVDRFRYSIIDSRKSGESRAI